MSEFQPKKHDQVMIEELPNREGVVVKFVTALSDQGDMFIRCTPDEAVSLGFALFEQGLFHKGKMKPQTE